MNCIFIIKDGFCECITCGFRTDILGNCHQVHRNCRGVKTTQNAEKAQEANCCGQPPSIAQKAINFATAVVEHTMAGFPVASPELAEKRLSICKTCTYFDPVNIVCNDCGCQLLEKVRWGEQKCPKDKW